MATTNPFASDPDKGEVFEQGYLAAFADPDVSDFMPLSPDLLDVYKRGAQSGRDDRAKPPAGEHGGEWVELGSELAEHAFVHALGMAAEGVFKVAGGLVSLVLTVITIPGDVMLHPLEPEDEMPSDQPGDTYLAMCTRIDHPMVIEGVTSDGYWTGPAREQWIDAANDRAEHGHPEALVARCSIPDKTCGPVWPVK
jgi:hypothetical protein